MTPEVGFWLAVFTLFPVMFTAMTTALWNIL